MGTVKARELEEIDVMVEMKELKMDSHFSIVIVNGCILETNRLMENILTISSARGLLEIEDRRVEYDLNFRRQ